MNQLRKIIGEIELSDYLALFLDTCTLKQIEVCSKSKSWDITLTSQKKLDQKHINEVNQLFTKTFPHVAKVNIKIITNEHKKTMEIDEVEWKKIKQAITKQLPVAKTFLMQATYTLQEKKIQIKIANRPGIQLFKDKLKNAIENHLKEQYNLLVKVHLNICQHPSEDNQPLAIDLQKELHERIVNATKNNTASTASLIEHGKERETALIMGRDNFTDVVPISQIIEEEKSISIIGVIFNLEEKVFKTGRKLITLEITDKTDSLTVKIFSPDKGEFNESKLKKGVQILVNGSVKFDTYSNELVLMAYNIKLVPAQEIVDHAEKKRIELHLHTNMSSMDGMNSLEEYIAYAAKLNHSAIAITDHGVVQAFPDAQELGKKYNIKILYGVEAYLANDQDQDPNFLKNSSYHVIILVQNYQGLKNLYKLISLAHLEYYYRRPKIPKSILAKYREGLLIGSACEAGELISNYMNNASQDKIIHIANFYDFLEIQPIGNNEFLIRNGTITREALQEMNRNIVQLGKNLNKPVVATGDVHFLTKEDAIFREILMRGKGFDDAQMQPPLYYRTTDQMLAEFTYLGEETAHEVVVENTIKINNLIEDIKPIPDEFYPPKIEGAEEQIIQMAKENATKLYGTKLPEVVEKRMKKELDSIINNGFAVLYLISHKLVKKSNKDGYLVGSRGSVGSSFVATLTGITEVNPLPPHYRCANCQYSRFIQDGSVGCGADLPDDNCPNCQQSLIKDGHDIPFEVFLGFKGDKVPDIDLNFSGVYQNNIMKYTEELFGKDYVYRAGTIATVAERTAYGFVQKYLDETNKSARTAEVNRLVKGCTGVKRTTGQHPGGLMIVPKDKDIFDFTPIQRPADDQKSHTITTHFDYHAISSRLVKLDILGHDDPTVIKMLEDLTGIDVKQIPLDEEKTMSLFSSTTALGVLPEDVRSTVGTYGIPEFGTRFVRQMLEDTKPKSFSELVRISGFSHGTDVWLNNAQNLIKQGIAKLSEAISTRDDIMVFLIYKGMEPSTAFKIMENVRKGKGLTVEQEDEMKKAKVPDWYIDSCKKIKYMFPKAHAVAYVMMAFRIAFFKVYYPKAFYASFFTVRADEFDAHLICQGADVVLNKIIEIEKKGNEASPKEKALLTILEVALEMYCRGINLKKVSLWESHSYKFLITPEGLLPPLASLQGVGENAASNIVAARKEKKFISIDDLRERTRVTKTVIEAMEEHGCLIDLPNSSQMELF